VGTPPLAGLLEPRPEVLERLVCASDTELLFPSLPPYAESRVISGVSVAPSLGLLSLLLLLKGFDIRHFDFFSFSDAVMLLSA